MSSTLEQVDSDRILYFCNFADGLDGGFKRPTDLRDDIFIEIWDIGLEKEGGGKEERGRERLVERGDR